VTHEGMLELSGTLECEQPNEHLYDFVGTFALSSQLTLATKLSNYFLFELSANSTFSHCLIVVNVYFVICWICTSLRLYIICTKQMLERCG